MAFRDAVLDQPNRLVADARFAPTAAWACSPRRQRRLSRIVVADLAALWDFIAVAIGGFAPIVLHFVFLNGVLDIPAGLKAAAFAGIFAVVCLKVFGLYDPSRIISPSLEAGKILTGLIVGIVGGCGVGMPDSSTIAHIALWYTAWISTSATLLFGGRVFANFYISAAARDGRFNQSVAIYGAGALAQRLCDELAKPGSGAALAGVFDDRAAAGARDDRRNSQALSIDGGLADLIDRCREGRVDRIIVALPPSADLRLAAILEKFERLPVSTHIVTHVASDVLSHDYPTEVSSLGAIGLLDVKTKALRDWAPVAKRLEDLALASFILIATAPLWPVIALAIKLDSRGPVLFRQARRGRHQSVIGIWKFRTMTYIETGAGVRQAVAGDVRVTRVGRLLRRTSLDELPQLLNVLAGDMSLVGPRPHALVHDQEFSRALELYPDRHQMRPGMTGLAQVSGLRGPTSKPGTIEARVEADFAYIQNWSIWLDLKILARTFTAVVRGENAT